MWLSFSFHFPGPGADGPLFVHANEQSLKSGTTVDQCFELMAQVSARFPFKVLMMGDYNTAFKMGEDVFIERLKAAGGVGFILPDLPIEEAGNLHRLADGAMGIEPVISDDSLHLVIGALSAAGCCESWHGLCCGQKEGVTGSKTNMGDDVVALIEPLPSAYRCTHWCGFWYW